MKTIKKNLKMEKITFLIGILIGIFLLSSISAFSIDFTNPTPMNNTFQLGDSIFVNSTMTSQGNSYTFSDFGNSLTHWLRFEQGNGTFFVDSNGNNNGTCTTTACPTFNSSGKFNGSYNFDGINDVVFFNEPSSLNVITSMTVSSWVKVPDASILSGGIVVDGNWLLRKSTNSMVFNLINNSGSDKSALTSFDYGDWVHYVGTYNGTVIKIYKNGVLANTNNITGQIFTSQNSVIVGRFSINVFFNGSIDEVVIFNRSLSDSEVLSLYNSSKYSNNFTNLPLGNYTFVNYGVNNTFVNKTDLRFVNLVNSLMNITFISQIPSDLNSLNIIGSLVNIYYNILDNNPINVSSIFINYKTNNSQNDCTYFINGTQFCGFQSKIGVNASSVWNFSLYDNNVLPATYNLDDDITDDTIHTRQTISSQNSFISTEFLDVKNFTPYNYFEVMSNSTAIQDMYYCNSSYSFSSDPVTDPSASPRCTLFNTLPPSVTFNHTHTVNSQHQVVPLVINVTTGMVGTVKVTNKSFIIIKGNTGISNAISFYTVPNISRNGVNKLTTNNGGAYANQSYTLDAHLHQFSGNDLFSYYVSECDTFGNCGSSLLRNDLLDLGGLKPTSPNVYSPTNAFYMKNVSINYTASISPNGYAISFYNVSLLNFDDSFNKSIRNNNGNNLSYIFDSQTINDGFYRIKVEGCDINSLCSYGLSSIFLIDNTPPYAIINSPLNNSMIQSFQINFSVNVYDNVSLGNITLFIYNSSGSLLNQSIQFSNATTGIFDFSHMFSFYGIYSFFVQVFDSVGNMFVSALNFFEVTPADPVVVINYPLNNITYGYTVSELDYSTTGSQSCWYSVNDGITNTSSLCGNTIVPLISSSGINSWSVYANNSVGNETGTRVVFNSTCINPNIQLFFTSYPYADINSSYTITVGNFISGNSNISIFVKDSYGNNNTYPLVYNNVTQKYSISLTFMNTTDYIYTIFGDDICPTVETNITGIVKVRNPYYIAVRVIDMDSLDNIENDRAYITAEYVSRAYDSTLESFISPLVKNQASVFHSQYLNGEAILKLYEPQNYAFRMIDGNVNFEGGEYSQTNITKSFGTNIYLGQEKLNGTGELIQFVLTQREQHPYRWLFNWILIIAVLVSIICGILAIFIIPQYPIISIVFAFIFPIVLLIFRAVIFFIGWG